MKIINQQHSLMVGSLLIAGIFSGCEKLEDPSLQRTVATAGAAVVQTKQAVPFEKNKQVLFGDLHIHTGLSTDAYIMGVRSVPEDVYRFAKGHPIPHGAGYNIQITRPLDFAAVTDHAEYLGQARLAKLEIPTTEQPLSELLRNGNTWEITLAWFRSNGLINDNGFSPAGTAVDKTINRSAWQTTIDAAQQHYQPGVFTSFIAYEWSADAGDLTAHMHRNVIYRGTNVAELPFSSLDSHRPEDLWAFLEKQNQQGKTAFAIPHNANFSRGNMYAPRDSEGKALTAQYAEMRNRYEPVSEILQIKGSSETHPLLSSEDEFANFAILGESLFTGKETMETIKGSYTRDALRVGMELSHSEGFNPFKFGVIGSSDSHNASSPSEENNYTGKLPMLDGSAGLRTDQALRLPEGINPVTRWGSGGLAAVWAEENTRESIFDALGRKETYATSGPRIALRFFSGWHFSAAMLKQNNFIEQAYAGGVPMGGELLAGPKNQAPAFVIIAAKDPLGANLDRVQIIKAWIDKNGKSHERVYDVSAADERRINPATGQLAEVGNTVDIKRAKYENSIGGAIISAHWVDPDFTPGQQAFYYARVLEIPTPRWSTYDAVTLGTEPMHPATIQERAISSAIWYMPTGSR